MKRTRYEPYTVEMTRTVEEISCDSCGTLTDMIPLHRPEGWITVFRQVDGKNVTRDFCGWDCFVGWVTAHDESDGGYIVAWQESIAAILTEKELARIAHDDGLAILQGEKK